MYVVRQWISNFVRSITFIAWNQIFFTQNSHQMFRHVIWFLLGSIIALAVLNCVNTKITEKCLT